MFNISVKDLLENDPSKFAAAINQDSPSGLSTSGAKHGDGTGGLNVTMFNLSEVLQGVATFVSPSEVLGKFEAIVGGTIGGISGDEEDDISMLLPNDLAARINSLGLDPFSGDDDDDSGGGDSDPGGGSGVDGGDGAIEGDSTSLSPNFRVSEFNSRYPNGAVPSAAVPSLRWLCVNVLEPLRDQFGNCRINSGYRTDAHNAAVGGARNSHHMYHRFPTSPAVDCAFARGTPREWGSATRRILTNRGGVGIYRSHLHVDNRSTKTNW